MGGGTIVVGGSCEVGSVFSNSFENNEGKVLQSQCINVTYEKAEKRPAGEISVDDYYRLVFDAGSPKDIQAAEIYKGGELVAILCQNFYTKTSKALNKFNEEYGLIADADGDGNVCSAQGQVLPDGNKINVNLFEGLYEKIIPLGMGGNAPKDMKTRIVFHVEGDPITPVAEVEFAVTSIDTTFYAQWWDEQNELKAEQAQKKAEDFFWYLVDKMEDECAEYICCSWKGECVDKCSKMNACLYWGDPAFNGANTKNETITDAGWIWADIYKEQCSVIGDEEYSLCGITWTHGGFLEGKSWSKNAAYLKKTVECGVESAIQKMFPKPPAGPPKFDFDKPIQDFQKAPPKDMMKTPKEFQEGPPKPMPEPGPKEEQMPKEKGEPKGW